MEALRKKFSSFKRGVKEFHTKKPQLEFFTALLTIPVLLTVIILNLNNLRGNQNKSATPTPVVITQTAKDDEIDQAQTTPTQGPCEPGIGEISIDSPEESENISDNPVMVDINYKAGDFCAVVWSYRINNGRYSDYDDRSIALYNLPNGNIKFDLRVKSVVNGQEKTLNRNFIYNGSTQVPTPTPTSAPSPTPTPETL